MQVGATMTSKGQLTVPKEVREALGLEAGDRVYFTVHERGAILTKIRDFLDLSGSVPVPHELRGVSWRRVREETWRERAGKRR
jgi:AbrB family looped-hinge helix DNA binding protein